MPWDTSIFWNLRKQLSHHPFHRGCRDCLAANVPEPGIYLRKGIGCSSPMCHLGCTKLTFFFIFFIDISGDSGLLRIWWHLKYMFWWHLMIARPRSQPLRLQSAWWPGKRAKKFRTAVEPHVDSSVLLVCA